MKKLVLLCSIAIFLFSCSKNFSPNSQERVVTYPPVTSLSSSTSKINGRLQQGINTKTLIYYIESDSDDKSERTRFLLKNPGKNLTLAVSERIFSFSGTIDVNSTKNQYRSNQETADQIIPNTIFVQSLTQRDNVVFRGLLKIDKAGIYFKYKIDTNKYIPIFIKKLPLDFDIKYVYELSGLLSYDCNKDMFFLVGKNPDQPEEGPVFVKTNHLEATLKISAFSTGNSTAIYYSKYIFNSEKNDYIKEINKDQEFISTIQSNEFGLNIFRYQGKCEPDVKDCQNISQYKNSNNLIILDPKYLINNSIISINSSSSSRTSPTLRIIVSQDPKYTANKKPIYYDFYNYYTYQVKVGDDCEKIDLFEWFCSDVNENREAYTSFIQGAPVDLISIEDIME